MPRRRLRDLARKGKGLPPKDKGKRLMWAASAYGDIGVIRSTHSHKETLRWHA
jgi:hypothetical protein